MLEPATLEVGADAFRKVHPDDAEQARLAVARAVANAGPREVAMRLVDKEGRARQYRTRVQALEGATPKRVLLVSRDVTDLRESEERVLLAAHATEGMTEAILITAADGTIVTVNRAFCELTGFKRDDILGQSRRIRNAPAAGVLRRDLCHRATRGLLVRDHLGAAQERRGVPGVALDPRGARCRRRDHAFRHGRLRSGRPATGHGIVQSRA